MIFLQPKIAVKSAFTQDVEDWFLRRRSGHMIRHYYSGKALAYWEAFTRTSKEYYLFNEEALLIQNNASSLSRQYRPEGNVTMVEFGTGGIKSADQKTLPFVKQFEPDRYIAVDWSEESAAIVSAVIEKETHFKTDIRVADFNVDSLSLPTGNKVIFQFGSTISNIEAFPEETLPFDILVRNLSNYKLHMASQDLLIIGMDQNHNSESLISSYSHAYHAAFSESLLYRIKEELEVSANFNPADFRYEPLWFEKNHQFVHALVAQKSGAFILNGLLVTFTKGDVFSYDNSFKYPQDIFEKALKLAGLSLIETIGNSRISLQIIKKADEY